MPTTPSCIIRIASNTLPTASGGAIAKQIREYGAATVQAIGASAVNQAVKSIIVASDYLAAELVTICTTMEFVRLEIDGGERTAIRFKVRQSYE